ncbi:uncharacterized protein BO97DRAFT_402173 [Aspergillus homomorphus CBS 101889]|uniref:Uncharacterized protein n=1 Tax=Aspergillus homomorphus (strain CBS 101889) TaxID=1450537 RepID=A0A395IC85_ASPHC|nr:hypothetical protein BO97DRAFT_402173 [Aspergillus homomorphus CBS 101889]RAL17641.1 hypothetical protein BO97DRAFT_402173 [Aspergillus homomorphus CBS 101889]
MVSWIMLLSACQYLLPNAALWATAFAITVAFLDYLDLQNTGPVRGPCLASLFPALTEFHVDLTGSPMIHTLDY